MSLQQQNQTKQIDIKQLYPARPIFDKPIKQLPKPVLKVELFKNDNPYKDILRPTFKKQIDENEQQQGSISQISKSGFNNFMGNQRCIYLKYDNKKYNMINGIQYYSSIFMDKYLIKNNKQQIKNLKQLLKDIQKQQLPSQNKKSKHQIIFDSHFESGNLFAVFKKSFAQYDLILQNDTNSKGNTQWFYFSVTNLPKDIDITFNIVNLLKSDSLFNYGMQPVIYSKIRNQKYGQGWIRSGKNISYYKNSIRRQNNRRYYHTLTFKIVSKHSQDTLYIAHCFPYTYTMLNEYLINLGKNQKKPIFERTVIGKTLGNNNIEVLTFSNVNNNEKKKDNRKIIVILARQHPGQSQGSYVCQGIINFLANKSKQSQFLKKHFIIKIIPMVNIDGVIIGNYRSNLMGNDLNRKWDIFDKQGCFPEVNCIKSYIWQINRERKLKFVLDLHGHSKKLNSFFYGNPNPQNPEIVRGFPYYCSKLNDQISFEDCTFTIEQQKKRAARVYLSFIHHLTTIYTFESSFYGYVKQNKKYQFGPEQYRNLGKTLCQGLFAILEHDYYSEIKTPQKISSGYQKLLIQLKQNQNLIMMGNKNQSGSQTNPEQFQMLPNQTQIINKLGLQQKQSIYSQLKNQSKQQISNAHSKSTSQAKYGRQIKDLKNSRNIKKLQLQRVHSIPRKNDQLQFHQLQTIHTIKQRELNHQFNKEFQFDKKNKKQRISVYTQTLQLDQDTWDQFRPISTTFVHSEKCQIQGISNTPNKDNLDLKYVSLKTQSRDKKRILKLDLVSKPVSINRIVALRNTYSQTFLSFTCKQQMLSFLPSVKNETRQLKQVRSKLSNVKTTRIVSNKKQNQDILTQMVKRYLMDMKQRHLKPIISYEQKNFNERSTLPYKIQSLMQKPLNIKKKQISQISKKGSPKK